MEIFTTALRNKQVSEILHKNTSPYAHSASLVICLLGKISAQPHPKLCIQFLNRGNNDKNNTFPLGKQICFTIVWGCAETLPLGFYAGFVRSKPKNG